MRWESGSPDGTIVYINIFFAPSDKTKIKGVTAVYLTITIDKKQAKSEK